MEFKDRLRQAMEAAEMTQTACHWPPGVGQPTVSQWARGQRTPDSETVKTIARELRATPEWLLEGLGQPPSQARRKSLDDVRRLVRWVARRAPRDGGRDLGNANQFTIRASIVNLIREAIQNALDEALGVGAVKMKFRLLSLRGEAKTRFLEAMQWDELRRHVEATVAQANNQQVAGGFQEALDAATAGELLVLQIVDENTRGLTGPAERDGNFAALTRDNLFSHKENESAGLVRPRQGNAIRRVGVRHDSFSATFQSPRPKRARLRAGSSREQNSSTTSTRTERSAQDPSGSGQIEPERPVSYWAGDRNELVRDLQMTRDGASSGTTIAIVGFRDLDADRPRPPREIVEDIATAAETNFWPAIEAGDLEIRVEYVEIEDPALAPQPEVDLLVSPGSAPSVLPLVDAYRKHKQSEVDELLIDGGDVVATTAELHVPARRTGDDPAYGVHPRGTRSRATRDAGGDRRSCGAVAPARGADAGREHGR